MAVSYCEIMINKNDNNDQHVIAYLVFIVPVVTTVIIVMYAACRYEGALCRGPNIAPPVFHHSLLPRGLIARTPYVTHAVLYLALVWRMAAFGNDLT